MQSSIKPHLLLAISALVIASIACQTLLGPDENPVEDPASIEAPSSNSDESSNPIVKASPEAQPTAISSRLSSENLPELNFGPVGDSPSDPYRPALSGSPQTLDTLHFRIHYSLSGDDAVPAANQDGNDHPDFVQEVAIALEYSWIAIIDHFGWAAPPTDEGIGGDDRYDVYLENIFEDGTAGYTEGGNSESFVGDNPNSAIVEEESSHSYMVLDNDYSEFENYVANGVTAIQFMRSTASHEFLHAVQYGYDGLEPLEWLWEASANWIQDEILNDYNDSIEDLAAVFKASDICQLTYGGEDRVESENHWYGLWIFFRFYSERYGHEAVIEIWESAVSLDGYDIWDQELSERGTTLQEFFRDYSVALLLRDFEEGQNYPSVRLEGEATLDSTFAPLDGVAQLGADYVRIEAEGPIRIQLDNGDLEILAVGISPDGQAQLFSASNGQISLNASDYDYLYLIVLNQAQANSEDDCRFSDYSFTVESGGQPSAPSLSISAPNFKAPRVEGLLNFDDSAGETPADLALIYIPDGYEYGDLYAQAREDFYDQDNIDNYVPGDGPVTVLDYIGPVEGDFLSLYESLSPYANLDEFFSAIGYEPLPGERRNIEGFDVLIEDYSSNEASFFVGTIIVGDNFYVIEGTISASEFIEVLAAWLKG